LREKWEGVSGLQPEEGGLLAGAGHEEKGGPPDRLAKLKELQVAARGEFDCSDASALHCAFSLLFWAHQQFIVFEPNQSVSSMGQQKQSSQDDVFGNILKALNLAQHLCRDVGNPKYSRYGKEHSAGLKEVSTFARTIAKGVIEHARSMKECTNKKMADALGAGL